MMATILVVCTGNLCRSPMVAALLADRLVHDPDRRDWRVTSAGVWAFEGRPASVFAVEEMRERGIDMRAHRSQPVTGELMEAADLVLAMTRNHVEALQAAFPDQAAKVHLLSTVVGRVHDIADPYGGSRKEYATIAGDLDALVAAGYDRIVTLAEAGSSEAGPHADLSTS